MGIEFIARTAPSFRKAMSRDAETVARMSSSVSSGGHRRVVVADFAGAACQVEKGQKLQARVEDGKLVLINGLPVVACVVCPPPDVMKAIEESGGYCDAVVEHVNSLGGTFDAALS